MTGRDRRPSERGSIFLEALVATAIVALILGATFQTVADSANRHRRTEARRYAMMIARSQLAAVGSAVPLGTGTVKGTDGGDVWQVDMQPCGSASSAGVLYCIAVTVHGSDGGPPLISLNSRRLAPLI
jgi:type II secretory pathway pseudopilin PulG